MFLLVLAVLLTATTAYVWHRQRSSLSGPPPYADPPSGGGWNEVGGSGR